MTVRELIYHLQREGGADLDSEVAVLVPSDGSLSGFHRTATLEGRHWEPGHVVTYESLPADMPREAKFLLLRLGAKLLPPAASEGHG